MATIIQKASDSTGVSYLLDGGKLVLLHEGALVRRVDVLIVDDASFANLETAYGAPVGT